MKNANVSMTMRFIVDIITQLVSFVYLLLCKAQWPSGKASLS